MSLIVIFLLLSNYNYCDLTLFGDQGIGIFALYNHIPALSMTNVHYIMKLDSLLFLKLLQITHGCFCTNFPAVVAPFLMALPALLKNDLTLFNHAVAGSIEMPNKTIAINANL